MAQIVFYNVRWLPVLMTILATFAVGFTYFLSIGKKQVPDFIPFIRHSAAYPPQSGIFSVFITIAAFFGMLTFLLRYAAVKNRSFHVEHTRYGKINEASLFMSLLFIVFFIYTSISPLGFQMNTKYMWVANVLIPSYVGALCICLCFDTYILIQAYMTYQHKRTHMKNVFIHSVLATCAIVSTWTAVIPISSSLKDEINSLAEDENGLVALEYKEYSFYSTICALSEWSFTFFILLFILTFYNDFKQMTVRIQVKPKRTICNSIELPTLGKQENHENINI